MKISFLIAKGLKKILNPPALNNCKIDNTSRVCSKSELSFVTVNRYSYVGNDCFMSNVSIGSFCSIADRCCIGIANHPIDRVSSSPVFYSGKNVLKKNFQSFSYDSYKQTIIDNDVWIGIGTIVKSGVHIHNGAVVGSGSVVTHDIPPYEIWAGNPAHKIRERFDKETVQKLEKMEWWALSDEDILRVSAHFDNVKVFIEESSL